MSATVEKGKGPELVITQSMFVTLRVKDNEGRRLTRTVRRTDKLQVLMDFYFDMVPTVAYCEGVFVYYGRPVNGEQTPADYEMKDGDELHFFPVKKGIMSVTICVKVCGRSEFKHTLGITDKLQDLMDLCCNMVPTISHGCGWGFLFNGRRVHGWQTPAELEMEDEDVIFCMPLLFG